MKYNLIYGLVCMVLFLEGCSAIKLPQHRKYKSLVQIDAGVGIENFDTSNEIIPDMFSYNAISPKPIPYKELEIVHLAQQSFPVTATDSLECSTHCIKGINNCLLTYFYVDRDLLEKIKLNDTVRNYIRLSGTKYYLDTIRYKDSFKRNDNEGVGLEIKRAYKLSCNHKEYLLLYIWYCVYTCHLPPLTPVLFDITKPASPVFIPVPGEEQFSDSPLAFGDFDGHSDLDFARINDSDTKNAKLIMYSLNDKGFVLNEKYYLSLTYFTDNLYTINPRKSHWTGPYGSTYKAW